jgi:uroporphyrinogen-III decarboxylase
MHSLGTDEMLSLKLFQSWSSNQNYEEEEEIYWALFDYKYMNNYIRVHKHIGVVLVLVTCNNHGG